MSHCTPDSSLSPTIRPEKLQEILAYSLTMTVLKPAELVEKNVYFIQN